MPSGQHKGRQRADTKPAASFRIRPARIVTHIKLWLRRPDFRFISENLPTFAAQSQQNNNHKQANENNDNNNEND